MAAKLKKSDLQQIIDLRKQRITSPADIARMGFRPRRPFRHSLAQELIRSFEKLGVDTKKLESAAQRDQRERRRLYEKQMARAKKNLAGIKNPFRYRIEERRKAFEKVSGITRPLQQPQAQSVVLDETFAILGTPNLLDPAWQSHDEPWNNFAKFAFQVIGDTQQDPIIPVTGEADFGFSWQNSYGQDVMINAQTLAMAKGICSMQADFGPAPLQSAWGVLSFGCELQIFQLWNEPFTSPSFEDSQGASFADLNLDALRLYYIPIGDDPVVANVLRTWPLAHQEFFTVPADGMVVFIISFTIWISQGSIDVESLQSTLDFFSDGNLIMCPYVWINVLVPSLV